MTKEEFHELGKRYYLGICSEEEKELYHAIYTDFQSRDDLGPDWPEKTKEITGHRIFARITAARRIQDEKETISWKGRWGSIAASVVFVIGIGWLAFNNLLRPSETVYLTKSTMAGQRSDVTLQDGSVIHLNSESTLRYPGRFEASKREVYLDGEAFFEVTPDADRPFIVRTEEINVRVLGTSFDVNVFEGQDPMVTVATGKVRVTSAVRDEGATDSIDLLPGEQAVFDRSLLAFSKHDASPGRYTAWLNRNLVFDLLPFEQVIERLSEAYHIDVKIEDGSSNGCLVRGKYQDERLVNVLNGLKLVVDFDYYFASDQQLIIKGHGCEN